LNQPWKLSIAPELDEPEPGLDLPALLRRVWSHSSPWICLFAFVGAAAGLVTGLLHPNTFASETKLFLRAGSREQVTSESLLDLGEPQRPAAPTMSDELQMLSDVQILERVARRVGPGEILSAADPSDQDGRSASFPVRIFHWVQGLCFRVHTSPHDCSGDCPDCLHLAVKTLRDSVSITNERPSNVIVISCTSTSPERARDLAQAVADTFVERHREQFSLDSLLTAGRAKLELAKQARDDAACAYFDFLTQSGLPDAENHDPAVLLGLMSVPNEEYETQLALKRSLLAQRQILLLGSHTVDEMHRVERTIDEQVARIDERLATALSDKRERAAHFNEYQRIHDDLDLARTTTELRYKQLLERFTSLESLANTSVQDDPNLHLLQAPTLEVDKIGPHRLLFLIQGVIAGIAAGLAVGLAREWFERRWCHPDTFESHSGIPVLAVVPHLPAWAPDERSNVPTIGWSGR
jgi:uncharacterized protein involved in exopolysaccharide biosynthesis